MRQRRDRFVVDNIIGNKYSKVGSVYAQKFYLTSRSDILSYSYGPCRPSAGRDSLLVPTVTLLSVGDATLPSRMLGTHLKQSP